MASFYMDRLESALAGLSETARSSLGIDSSFTLGTVSSTGLASSSSDNAFTPRNAIDFLVRNRIFREMFQSELRERGLQSLDILLEKKHRRKQHLEIVLGHLGIFSGRKPRLKLPRDGWAWLLRAKRKLRAIREQIQKVKELEGIVNMKVDERMARRRHRAHTPSRVNE